MGMRLHCDYAKFRAWTAHLVAITGYGSEQDRRAAQEAGFSLDLTKPVDPVRLENLLATLG